MPIRDLIAEHVRSISPDEFVKLCSRDREFLAIASNRTISRATRERIRSLDSVYLDKILRRVPKARYSTSR